MKLWKLALATLLMMLGAGQAQAQLFFTANGSVLGQPSIVQNGQSGTITFNDAELNGLINYAGSYTTNPFSGRLNFALGFNLGNSGLIVNPLPNVIPLSSAGSFNAENYRTNISLVNGSYNGLIQFFGNVPGNGYGRLNVAFQGNAADGFVSTFLLQVPEPATWGLMLAGFGLLGAGMRTRRRSVTFKAA